MNFWVIATSTVQIAGDVTCVVLAAYLLLTKSKKKIRLFFILILLSFFTLALGDIYYNYMYRLMRYDIRHSLSWFVTFSFITFQISQLYNWLYFVKKQEVQVLSKPNIPYLLSTALVIGILIYYLFSNSNYETRVVVTQSIGVMIDMAIWLFAIVCLANTTSSSITFLSLGCLLIISSDLTTRCLYIFEPDQLASTYWVHVVWAAGVWMTAWGLYHCMQDSKFNFSSKDSLLVNSNSQMVMAAFIAFLLCVVFLSLFKLNSIEIDMHAILWSIPIVLIFTLSLTMMLAKKFSAMLTQPLDEILTRINLFDSGSAPVEQSQTSKIQEFNLLDNFISTSFNKLTSQLEHEVKVAAQVSHDISSPLSSLDMLVRMSSGLEELNRILLRNAVNDIRSIVFNLQKDISKEVKPTQLIVLVGYTISQANMLIGSADIKIEQNVSISAYLLFVNVSSSMMKTILTNIINNAIEALEGREGKITISVEQNINEKVRIIIGDNGLGIPASVLERIFERGFTTKPTGSGLGLYSAKENIHKWGGTIDIKSNPEEGAIIEIELPLEPTPVCFIHELSLKYGMNIICVDDNISNRDTWRAKIFNYGMNLIYCQHKEDLIDQLEILNDKEAIFLVDYEFAGQNYTGKDLIKLIMAKGYLSTQIHLVTSRSDEVAIQNYCIDKDICIIPKIFVPKIPIKITT